MRYFRSYSKPVFPDNVIEHEWSELYSLLDDEVYFSDGVPPYAVAVLNYDDNTDNRVLFSLNTEETFGKAEWRFQDIVTLPVAAIYSLIDRISRHYGIELIKYFPHLKYAAFSITLPFSYQDEYDNGEGVWIQRTSTLARVRDFNDNWINVEIQRYFFVDYFNGGNHACLPRFFNHALLSEETKLLRISLANDIRFQIMTEEEEEYVRLFDLKKGSVKLIAQAMKKTEVDIDTISKRIKRKFSRILYGSANLPVVRKFISDLGIR